MSERPLDPPDNDIDYDREEEQIEQSRANETDKIWESIRDQFIEIARSQK